MSAPPAASTPNVRIPAHRLLLIFFGQMGDAVLALPAAQALRRAYPQAQIMVLASPSAAEVLRMAGFEETMLADRAAWKRAKHQALLAIPALIARLRRARFDLSVDLHSFAETNLLAFAAGIPRRVAMLRRTRSLPRLITDPPPQDEENGRLVDRYCAVLEPLGICVADRRERLEPPPAARAAMDLRLAPLASKPLLGICPGAGHPGRRWPAERFAALSGRLRALARGQGEDAHTLVFAGPEEPPAVIEPLAAQPDTTVLRGLSVAEMAAALARCRLVVSNPTGPSHIAAAVGAYVLSLGEIPAFDPIGTTPEHVRVVRATRVVADIDVEEAVAAACAQWERACRG